MRRAASTSRLPTPGSPVTYDVVVPTVGRSSLATLVAALRAQVPPTTRIVVVDDRPAPSAPLDLGAGVVVRRSGGRGPAFARNVGWSGTEASWIVFVDDDVRVGPEWSSTLAADLVAVAGRPEVGAVQGRVQVPVAGRSTDWQNSVRALEQAAWITADMAVKVDALRSIGGFDPTFPHAFREDTDLAIRLRRAGWTLVRGARRSTHPVAEAPWWESVRRQRGNADDARLLLRHGWGWRRLGDVPRGRRPIHAATVAVALLAVSGRRSRRGRVAALVWGTATAELTARRWWGASRRPGELAALFATSLAIPPAAVGWWLQGLWRGWSRAPRVDGLLFDRDGTLIVDVPYNGDPERVDPVPDGSAALRNARCAGVAVGVVSNQSGIGRGLLSPDDVRAVNSRVEEVLGPFDVWEWCGHVDGDGCTRRKPHPGLVIDAAASMGVDPRRCVVIGDIGADVEAALAAGATAIMVPTAATRPAEVLAAPTVVDRLAAATELALLTPGPGR